MIDLHKPESVGISSERLERLNEITSSYVNSGKFAGISTLVARRGQIVHFKCSGMRSVEENKPIEVDTIFRIYSMTKPITSVAIMMLYERGLLRLESPVANFIPEFVDLKVFDGGTIDDYKTRKPEAVMTIADLLKHTSGLSYAFMASSVVDDLYTRDKIFFTDNPSSTAQEQIKKLANVPLKFSPGTAWNYSLSTDVLGYIVEVISGKPLDEFFKKEIFEPLGMMDTDFYVPEEKLDRLASLYFSKDANIMVNIPNLEELMKDKHILLAEDPSKKQRAIKPPIFSGGGGLLSTLTDYYKFLNMLMNKGRVGNEVILSSKSIELMTINHLPAELRLFKPTQHITNSVVYDSITRPGFGFGLGFSMMTDLARSNALGSVGEYFWGGAASTVFLNDPKEDLIMVLMTQLMPSSTYPLRDQIRVALYQSLLD